MIILMMNNLKVMTKTKTKMLWSRRTMMKRMLVTPK